MDTGTKAVLTSRLHAIGHCLTDFAITHDREAGFALERTDAGESFVRDVVRARFWERAGVAEGVDRLKTDKYSLAVIVYMTGFEETVLPADQAMHRVREAFGVVAAGERTPEISYAALVQQELATA